MKRREDISYHFCRCHSFFQIVALVTVIQFTQHIKHQKHNYLKHVLIQNYVQKKLKKNAGKYYLNITVHWRTNNKILNVAITLNDV